MKQIVPASVLWSLEDKVTCNFFGTCETKVVYNLSPSLSLSIYVYIYTSIFIHMYQYILYYIIVKMVIGDEHEQHLSLMSHHRCRSS